MIVLQKTLSIYLTIILIMIAYSQNFTVDISQAILLHQNKSNIKTTGKDLEGNQYVGFENKQVRKYSADFTTYTSYLLLQAADTFNTRGTSVTTTLSNSTTLTLSDKKIVIRTNQMTVIRDYNYATFASQEVFQIGKKIVGQMGFPIKVGNISHMFHVVNTMDSILIAYRGQINTLLNLSSTFNSNSTILTAYVFQSANSPTNADIYYWNLNGYLSLSNKNTYSFTIDLSFTFNYTINHYDLSSQNISYTSIHTSTSPVTKLIITNNILMMQSNATGISNIYDITNRVMGSTANIPLNQTFNFFYIYNTYYVLQSTGLCKLSYNSPTKTLSLSNVVVTLPYNTYGINFGSIINPFYTPNLPYLYKAGPCLGNSVYSGSLCNSYTCSVLNCQSCGVIQNYCDSCSSGYILISNQCSLASNVSNSSINTNSTSSLNSEMSPFDQMLFFQSFLKWLFNILAFLISIPTARRVLSPAFYYFGVFDDIYFYQFHDRLYGDTMNSVFDSINKIQNSKWSILNSQFFSIFGTTVDEFQQSVNLLQSYQSFPYSSTKHTVMGSEGLMYNCYNFFIFAMPITIVAFIIGRFMFNMLYQYRISKPFRKFSFWSILILLLFDGNIQQFTFYMVNQWKNSMSFDISIKFFKVLSIIFGFIVVVFSIGIYFKSYSFYCRLNRFMMDNNKNYLLGQTGLLLQFGIKNIVLGFANSLLRVWPYQNMVIIIIIIEVFFFFILISSIAFNIYKSQTKIWIYLSLNMNKIFLLLTLSIDYDNINTQTLQWTQQIIIIIEICLYIFRVLHQTLQSLYELFISIRALIMYDEDQQLKIKQQQNMKEIFNYKSTHVYIKNIDNFNSKTAKSIKAQLRPKTNGNGLRKVLTAYEEPKDLKNKGLRQSANKPNQKVLMKRTFC